MLTQFGQNPLEPEQPTYTIIFIDVDAKQVKEVRVERSVTHPGSHIECRRH